MRNFCVVFALIILAASSMACNEADAKNRNAKDVTAPVIGTFSVPETSASLVVNGIVLAASDNKGVTGYLVKESSALPSATSTGWSSTAPSSFTFTSGGSKTLYAWARDAAGNISASKSASLIISLVIQTPTPTPTITPPDPTAPIPQITAVSGFATTGQILTITGTNLVAEDTSHWDNQFQSHPLQYGFEGTRLDGSDGWYGTKGGAYDATLKLAGYQSLRCHVAGGGINATPNDGGDSVWYNAQAENPNFFFRFYSRWHALNNVWPDNYTKLIFTGMTGTQWYFELNGGATQWYYKWSGYDTGYVPIAGGGIQNDRWYLIEGAWTTSPSRAMKVWVDNQLVLDAVPTTTFGNTFPNIGIINYSSLKIPVDLTNWIDNFAFSSSNRIFPSAIVELSGSAGTWKYQEPVFLSDRSIQIKADLTEVGSGPYRLRVTNNGQQTSAIFSLQ